MNQEKPIPKIYVAVCGLVDSGKSTFVKNFVKTITNRDISVDALCQEQENGKTIRSAQIVCHLDYVDIILLDCPGHLEYIEETRSCLSKAHIAIFVKDAERLVESTSYETNMKHTLCEYFNKLQDFTVISHSKEDHFENYRYEYDVVTRPDNFKRVSQNILSRIIQQFYPQYAIDVEENAIRIIRATIKFALEQDKKCMGFISYGKDSLVLLKLLQLSGAIQDKNGGGADFVKLCHAVSGFDMPGLNDKFKNDIQDYFGVQIEPFNIVPCGWTFDNHSSQDIALEKGKLIMQFIKENKFDFVFTGIRRDEEGTRSKEKVFSHRSYLNNHQDLYKMQLEIYRNEIDVVNNSDFENGHYRVSPLLDLTELDIWILTKKYNLPICPEYFSVDGVRYRSLGDWPITTPIQSTASNIDEIIQEVGTSLVPERACRTKQDNEVKYGFEQIRTNGFF